jgi:hypothetical protein
VCATWIHPAVTGYIPPPRDTVTMIRTLAWLRLTFCDAGTDTHDDAEQVAQVQVAQTPVVAVAAAGGASLIACASAQGRDFAVWQLTPGAAPLAARKLWWSRGARPAAVRQMKFSSDAAWLLACSSHGTTHLFPVKTHAHSRLAQLTKERAPRSTDKRTCASRRQLTETPRRSTTCLRWRHRLPRRQLPSIHASTARHRPSKISPCVQHSCPPVLVQSPARWLSARCHPVGACDWRV